MCGRYWIDESPEMSAIAVKMNQSALVRRWEDKAGVRSSGEIRPADVVPVIASDRNKMRSVYPMRWGFSEKSLLINARSESASEKPLFREAWASRRCIIPASWYYEWEHRTGNNGKFKTGDKYAIRPKDNSMTWLCGLYRIENGLPVFVVLTREPGEEIRFIHDRMPMIMPEDLIGEWIRPDADPDMLVRKSLTSMVYKKEASIIKY